MRDVKFRGQKDCGNAPRKVVIEQILLAIAEQNIPHLQEQLAEDIQWDFVGNRSYRGIKSIAEALDEMPFCEELIIENTITHGRDGAVSGEIIGNGLKFGFSHICQFASAGKQARLKRMTTYLIQIGETDD
ncbi:hypothetical protein [Solibacillus sp. CAU 1738]|uniref:hypothetical protein n=1 Tax=Solibacillus sp. CAU 1738 TaxID=3140363 RepID=UPI003260B0AF